MTSQQLREALKGEKGLSLDNAIAVYAAVAAVARELQQRGDSEFSREFRENYGTRFAGILEKAQLDE